MQKQNADKQNRGKGSIDFHERMNSAAAAKKAQLEAWHAKKVDTNDPAFIEQQAARQATAAARAERDAQRRAEKESAKAQAIADRQSARDAAEAQETADRSAREAAAVEAEAARAGLEADRKAARDARYAARKARNSRK